ncbi:MAG: FkbM family methyltransferase [Oceanicaulis sp.]|nr:FkbM family methyltransferase [Oceanicaulis sp.]
MLPMVAAPAASWGGAIQMNESMKSHAEFFKDERALSRFCLEFMSLIRSGCDKSDRQSLLDFMAFALPIINISKGQLFQDIWALWESGEKRGGYFVEIGGSDGVSLSNSYMLEKEYEWKGIVAEPNPSSFQKVSEARDCYISNKCVFSETGNSVDFLIAPFAAMSRMNEIIPEDSHEVKGKRTSDGAAIVQVSTITLSDLLIEAGAPEQIDFMSIDTEGSEYEILNHLDFSRWSFSSICVEHNYTPARERIYDLMTRNGYKRKWESFSRFDDWYIPVD